MKLWFPWFDVGPQDPPPPQMDVNVKRCYRIGLLFDIYIGVGENAKITENLHFFTFWAFKNIIVVNCFVLVYMWNVLLFFLS